MQIKEISKKNTLTTLDAIIKEVQQPLKKQQESPERKLIVIDAASGEIKDSNSFLLKLVKKLRYFEINLQKIIFNIEGPKLPLENNKAITNFVLNIKYDAKINTRGLYNLMKLIARNNKPVTEIINAAMLQVLSAFVFERPDFVIEFKRYMPELEEVIRDFGRETGLELRPKIISNIPESGGNFVFTRFEHAVLTKTCDAQNVEISHTVTLTPVDHIKFHLSGIRDARQWAQNKLDQFTHNAIIDKNYADVLIGTEDFGIKGPMEQACRQVGYELKQLVTKPTAKIETVFFETAAGNITEHIEFVTKDPRLKISLNIIVDGTLDMKGDRIKKHIRAGVELTTDMKQKVIDYTRKYINPKTPYECLSDVSLEINLAQAIKEYLESDYSFKKINITIKFLETELSKRYLLLQGRPYKIDIEVEWSEQQYALWFRVTGVDPAPDSWFRFWTNNYKNTEEELAAMGRMLKNGLEMKLFRPETEISSKMIKDEFDNISKRIITEFGLQIDIHDFSRLRNEDDQLLIGSRKNATEGQKTIDTLWHESRIKEMGILLAKREEAIHADEPPEVIAEIDRKIEALHTAANIKMRLLGKKTGNDFPSQPTDGHNPGN